MKSWFSLFILKFIHDTDTILSEASKKSKKKRIRCPICGWQPDGKPYWWCEKCHAKFDTFKTHAHCPNPACGNSWTFTRCISCRADPPHEDWYEDVDE